jgi:drug/metabolite transporter (DMT)-like permease
MPVLCILGTVYLWSLIPLAVKVAYGSFNFGFIAFARLATGTLIFALLDLRARRGLRLPSAQTEGTRPGPTWISPRVWMVVAGLGIGADLVIYTLGLRYTTASAATLIVSTDGIILALLAVLVLREPVSWLKGGAGLCALGGLTLVGWNGQNLSVLVRSEYFLGNVIVLCAAFCWAAYGLGQRALARMPGGSLVWIFLVGTALAAVVAFARPIAHSPITWKPLVAVLYLGIGGTGLAYVLFAKGMAKLEAATVGVVSSTLPLFTMVQAHYFRGEEITPYLLGGAALVIAGVTLIMRHQKVYGVQ